MDFPTIPIFPEDLPQDSSRAPLIAALAASKAPEIRRAYRTAWTFWTDWASDHGYPILPAESEHAASFLAARFAGGASVSTLRMACAAIGEAVAVIRAHLDLQRNREKAAKTMAIVSVVSDAGLRRSEAAALR